MKKLWLVVSVLIAGFLLYRKMNDPTQQLLEDNQQLQATTLTLNTRDEYFLNEVLVIDELDDDHSTVSLHRQVETFIHLYYDWNYEGMTGLDLHDFVTHQFFHHVASDLMDSHAHVHHHAHGDEYFVMFEATAHIFDLKIYVALDDDLLSDINMIVTFDVVYDIPDQEPFSRRVVTWLEVCRDELRVNHKIVLN